MSKIISRKDARRLGLKRFFTGKACSNGHVCEGLVHGMSCIECFYDRQKQGYYANHENRKRKLREYGRRERSTSPEKQRERYRKHYYKDLEKTRKQKREAAKQRRDADLISARKLERENYKKHPEQHRERQRRYSTLNSQKIKEMQSRWWREGPQNPKGELQWLRKHQAQLRNVKRTIKNMSRGAPISQIEV